MDARPEVKERRECNQRKKRKITRDKKNINDKRMRGFKMRIKWLYQTKINMKLKKPWKDPESLFCDGDFLTNFIGKAVRKGDEI